ncbi:MAG: sugar-binding domain-containing protein, partial [Melioribacteraceae bacterium]
MKLITKLSIILFILTLTMSCVKNDSPETIDLSKNWQFSPDEKNIGITEKWYSVNYDDSNWDKLDAGKRWEDQGYPNLDGDAWYRKIVDIPADWRGKDVYVKFAAVNDTYDFFVNGEQLSTFGVANVTF